MTYFDDKLGVNFGWRKKTGNELSTLTIAGDTVVIDTSTDPIKGLKLLKHSHRDFGLYPVSKPVITAPEVQESYIEVPGMDGLMDATQTLDGIVHYRNREATMEYIYIGDRQNWDSVYHKILAELHGQKIQFVLDDSIDGYYAGRLTIDEPEYETKLPEARHTINGNVDPFKLDFNENGEDWLWDPFSFETGIAVDETEITITNSKTVTLYGSHYAQVPDIYVNSITSQSLTVAYTNVYGSSVTKTLATGSNVANTPDLVIRRDELPLTFTGSGSVTIKFKRGYL